MVVGSASEGLNLFCELLVLRIQSHHFVLHGGKLPGLIANLKYALVIEDGQNQYCNR